MAGIEWSNLRMGASNPEPLPGDTDSGDGIPGSLRDRLVESILVDGNPDGWHDAPDGSPTRRRDANGDRFRYLDRGMAGSAS